MVCAGGETQVSTPVDAKSRGLTVAKTRPLFEGLEQRILLSTVTVVNSFSFGPFVPGVPANGTFDLPQFNSQNGTLHLASFRITITLQSQGGATGLENQGPGSGTATVTVGTDATIVRQLHAPGPPFDVVLSATRSVTNPNIQPDQGNPPDFLYPNDPDNDSVVVIGGTAANPDTDTKVFTSSDPATLAEFIGTGSVTFDYTSVANNATSDNIGGNIKTNAVIPGAFFFTGQVEYTGDAPELTLVKGVVATDGQGRFTGPLAPPGIAFTPPGSAGPRFVGVISSTLLGAQTIDYDLVNAKKGDLVTFAMVLQNVADAGVNGIFDVGISDTLPAGFAIPPAGLNLTVTDGSGAAIAIARGHGAAGAVQPTDLFHAAIGIELVDPGPTAGAGQLGAIDPFDAVSGHNIAVITYDLQVATAAHAATLVNTATVYNQAGVEGGPNLGTLTDPASVSVVNFSFVYDVFSGEDHHHHHGPHYPIFPHRALAFEPLYSGTADPGATLEVNLYDPRGNLIGQETTVADAGGNWMASFFKSPMRLEPHSLVIRQTYAGESPAAQAGYNLRTYYSPAVHGGTFISEWLTVENVTGKGEPANAVWDLYRASLHPIAMGWGMYSYELLAAPPTASGN
jgi:hypothetical protein